MLGLRVELGPSRMSWVEDGVVYVAEGYPRCIDYAWPWWTPGLPTNARVSGKRQMAA